MPIIEVTVVPLGTGSTSLSPYVRKVYAVVESSGLSHRLTPMGTCLEGEWDELFAVVKRMHEACFEAGAQRVSTSIRVDDRRDRPARMHEKVDRILGPSG
jgi:uncharacterized protein (TIGR00106 family)